MSPFNESEEVIMLTAETQGQTYQLAYAMGFDMEDFSNKYLTSDFCRNEMDSVYSKFQTEFPEACMDELLIEWEEKGIEVKKRDSEFAYSSDWIGNMYRYLFFALQVFSSDLLNLIPFKEICRYQEELEECDYKDAVNCIREEILQLRKNYVYR